VGGLREMLVRICTLRRTRFSGLMMNGLRLGKTRWWILIRRDRPPIERKAWRCLAIGSKGFVGACKKIRFRKQTGGRSLDIVRPVLTIYT
jgi:hypothetical protein